jgi:hypothetical protein
LDDLEGFHVFLLENEKAPVGLMPRGLIGGILPANRRHCQSAPKLENRGSTTAPLDGPVTPNRILGQAPRHQEKQSQKGIRFPIFAVLGALVVKIGFGV